MVSQPDDQQVRSSSYTPPGMSTPLVAPIAAARATQPRGGLATLAVLLIMVGILVGGFMAVGAVANVPSAPVTVASGVVVTPLTGWEFGGRSEDGKTILMSQGD